MPSGHDPPLLKRPDGDQVVLAARHNELTVGRPANAQEAAEKGRGQADELHGVVVEDPEAAVLRYDGQIFGARREGEIVDGTLTDDPPVFI